MNTAIFKAYDVRGLYPSEINEDLAYAVGRAVVAELDARTIAVGQDARPHGASLKEALIRGIMDAGCHVIDLGMITTPMLYFASWHLPSVDGAVSITASHNPVEYNGIKICRRDAVPVGLDSGLAAIRDAAAAFAAAPKPLTTERGTLASADITDAYYAHIASFADFKKARFSLVIDCANTMGVLELPLYERFSDVIAIDRLYCDLDHPYTAHEANPLHTPTLDELRERVVATGASLGIAYDGDADRVGFVDETGAIIPMDLMTGLISRVLLTQNPRATILYDLRSSQAVKEVIEESGGTARECRVGHAFIKKQMRDAHALFAGELSGHYYFNANHNGELSTLAAVTLLNLMAHTKKPASALVADLRRYHHSGEINSEVRDKDAIMTLLKEKYRDGTLSELDGIKISYWNDRPVGERWWFNVRPSNTEPVLRLNVEADTVANMIAKRDELLAIIRA